MKYIIIMSIFLTSCGWSGHKPETSTLDDRKCALKYPKHDRQYCPESWNGFREER